MSNRTCFELPVKMITASALTGVRHSDLWRRECRFRQAACLTIAQRFSALALSGSRLVEVWPIIGQQRTQSLLPITRIIGSDGFHSIAFVVSSSEVAGGKPDAQFAEFGMCADGASAPLLSAASGARLRAGPGQPSS